MTLLARLNLEQHRSIFAAFAAWAAVACVASVAQARCGDYVIVGNAKGKMSHKAMAESDDPMDADRMSRNEPGLGDVLSHQSVPPCSGPNCDDGDSSTPQPTEFVLQRLTHEVGSAASYLGFTEVDSQHAKRQALAGNAETRAGYRVQLLRPPQDCADV